MRGEWIPTSRTEALPAFGERVLISTLLYVEFARRVEMSGAGNVEGPAYVWELERTPAHYDPRSVTHWRHAPARP